MPDTKTPKTWQPGAVPSDDRSASTVTRNSEDDKWDRFIDNTLTEWGRDPSEIQDAGIDAPSSATISQAIDLARRLRDLRLPAPTSVVPDPNGGIVFRRQAQDVSEEYHIWDDGVVEYLCFQGPRLVRRQKIA